MATIIPSQTPTTATRDIPTAGTLHSVLGPWRRRIWIQKVFFWGVRGLLVGLCLACLVLIVARIVPWAQAPYWALGLGGAFPVLGIALALWLRPTFNATAQNVDHRLGLHDRIGTAWELREQTSILVGLQRRDALKKLQVHTPGRTISLRLRRATCITLIALLLLLVPLILVPNPMTAILKQQAALQTQIAKQVNNIDKLKQVIAKEPSISQDQKQKIDKVLSNLQNKLQQAKNPTEAQQALSEAQTKLDQLRDPQAANKNQARSSAGDALKSSSNSSARAAGDALSKNDSKSLNQALQDLARQAKSLTPEQRKQLAQEMEKAANRASQDPALSSSLHQLAKSLADGSSSEISDAAKAVGAASSQSSADQAGENAINQASQGLQNSANDLASATDNTTGQAQQGQQQGQQGQGQGQQGQGQQGQGQGQQGQGQQGQGQGQQGQGQQGQGGSGGQGGHGGGGGQGGTNGTGNHKNERVYVQGQSGQGSSTQSNDNNTGTVQPGSDVPYSQVIEKYNQKAHDAIDNSNVSPNQKDLVHDYFNTLEGQQ